MTPKKILFVCIGNASRSQMAEGFAKAMGQSLVEVYSAGSRPVGFVDAHAIAVMKEKGIDISQNKSKGLHQVPKETWDYVVTMGCGEEACSKMSARKSLDWPLENPAGISIERVRLIRDQIHGLVKHLLGNIEDEERERA